MRFSNALIATAATLLLSTTTAAYSDGDYAPSSSSYPSSSRKSTSGKKKRRRKSSKPSVSRRFPPELTEFDDFPLEQLEENEDEARLLSALERIEQGTSASSSTSSASTIKKGKRKKSKKRKRPPSSIGNNEETLPPATTRPSAAAVTSVTARTTSHLKQQQDEEEASAKASSVAAIATRTSQQQQQQQQHVPHTVTQHTYHHRATTAGSTAAPTTPLPYPRYRPPVSTQAQPQQQQQQQQSPQQQQRAAMLSYTTPWVINFLQARPKDALLAVPRDFLGDGFNLVHLPPIVERLGGSHDSTSFSLYKAALRLILSNDESMLQNTPPSVQRAAESLYTLVHARYITSPRGLDTVRRLLTQNKDVFGKCPQPSCRGMPLLPHGETSDYGHRHNQNQHEHASTNAQRYCCCCGNVWEHWDSKVDGSAWGPSFCHLYLLTYGKEAFRGRLAHSALPDNPSTVPTIFGFQVHTAALRRLHEL